MINNDVKGLFGRVIGSISKKYYDLVITLSRKNNTFTCELRSDSKAQKLFLNTHRNNSLHEQKITEKIAFKEFLVFFKNTNQSDAMMRYLQEIKSLDLDIALVKDYIYELSQGIISQDLIDEIETQYEENEYSFERMKQVDAIGNPMCYFDFFDIHICYEMLKGLISRKINCEKFAKEFQIKSAYLDEEGLKILEGVDKICSEFLSKYAAHKYSVIEKEFIANMTPYLEKFKIYYNI